MVKYKIVYKDYNCHNSLILSAVPRLIAVGDIHGDMDLMIDSLTIANLIVEVDKPHNNTVRIIYKDGKPKHFQWTGGKTVVVQVGDQVDRCRPFYNAEQNVYAPCNDERTTYDDEASDEKILVFFSDLDKLARKQGGAVYSLIGNHELMNVMGNMDYVSYLGLKEYMSSEKQVNATGRINHFKRGSDISKFMACTRAASIIVGSYMFVHGGFLSNIIKGYDKKDKHVVLDNLNTIVQMWLLNKDETTKDAAKLLASIKSPFWVRGLGNIQPNLPKDHENCQDYNKVLDFFSIKGMIVGHTPQLETGINGTCGNSLFRVDVASSKAFYNVFKAQNVSTEIQERLDEIRQAQVLEIINDKEIYVIGKTFKKKLV